MNMDSDKKVFKSERVDIMKLSYSNDYQINHKWQAKQEVSPRQ